MNNKYGVLIEANEMTISGRSVRYQLAVINTSSGRMSFHRITDGGRGVNNAWRIATTDALDHSQTFTTEPMAVIVTEKQAQITADLFGDPTGALPSNTLAELTKQKRVDYTPQTAHAGDSLNRSLATILGEVELAFIEPDQATLKSWDRGEDTTQTEREPKATRSWVATDNKTAGEYKLPEQVNDLVAWATLRTPDPNTEENKRYVERTIAGRTLSEWFDHASKRRKAVVIFGPAGSGKTSAAYYRASQLGLPLTIVECNPQMDNSVIQGKFVPTGKGNELMWRYSALATAITKPGVILLNEVSRMTPKANSLFMKLLAEKELIIDTHHNEVLELHPDCLIIADANPSYRGTMLPDEAFLDRFTIKLEFDYDTEIEQKFIPSEHLLELATELRRAALVEGKFSVPISTRLLLSFVDVALDLGYEAAVYNFVNAFPTGEREPLSMLFSTYEENITDDLALIEVAGGSVVEPEVAN